MGNKNLIKRSIFKEKISELKSKKFSFEINRIELPNGHEGEYALIIAKGKGSMMCRSVPEPT